MKRKIFVKILVIFLLASCGKEDKKKELDAGTDRTTQPDKVTQPEAGTQDRGTQTPMECNPVTQEGCEPNQKCGFVMKEEATDIHAIKCVPIGEKKIDEECEFPPALAQGEDVPDNCGKGLGCMQLGRDPGQICHQFCAEDKDCPDDRACLSLKGKDFKLCGSPPVECDPVKNTGCNSGQKCIVRSSDGKTECVSAGNLEEGAACRGTGDCKATLICIQPSEGEKRCHRMCYQKDPKCPQDLPCRPKGEKYGICFK
jgi:hypothetical protein